MYSLQFSKNFPLPKNDRHFEFLPKMAKHEFASISLTVRDRAISSKFLIHRVSKECNLCNFQKNFPSPKMAAILNFRIFAKFVWTNRFQVRVRKRKCGWTDGWTDKRTKNGQTSGRNFANLISKLNFYKLIPYPMDRQGPPNWPRYHFTRDLIGLDNEKDAMTLSCLDRKYARGDT